MWEKKRAGFTAFSAKLPLDEMINLGGNRRGDKAVSEMGD